MTGAIVEEEAGCSGPAAVARYLGTLARELDADRIVNPRPNPPSGQMGGQHEGALSPPP